MKGLRPEVIEYLDTDGIPNTLKLIEEKQCACGQGVDRLVYGKAKSEMHYWYAQHKRCATRERQLKLELKQSQVEINVLKQKLYGKRTEKDKRSEKQFQPDNQLARRPRGQQRGSAGHGRTQNTLEIVEETIKLSVEKSLCPSCQQPYVALGSTEDSDLLEITVKAYKRRIKREKYKSSCRCAATPPIITAPSVPRLIPKGQLGISIWASILLDKYGGHTPTRRYLDKLEHHGIVLAQGTVTDGLKRLAPLFTLLVQRLMSKNQQEKHWHADETRWEVFESVPGKVGSRWYLWVFKSKSVVYYKLSPSRGYCVPKDFFSGTDLGILSCDRYVVYKKLENNGIVILAFCWAHVRRDFLDIEKSDRMLASWARQWVERIGVIYHLNNMRSAAQQRDHCHTAHQKLVAAIAEMAKKLAEELSDKTCPHAAKKVLESLSNHWRGLTVFIDHPEIPMDNNPAERQLRGPVTGRKGYYGSGSIWSAELAAALFTVIQTMKLWNINPLTYLHHYLEACLRNDRKPPPDMNLYLPWEMSKNRQALLSKPPNLLRLSQPPINTSIQSG